ncbi:MBL fold metallo-hydrolase [Candidatus Woesearchaeota archaeon]|nr:MBL fold metallo-hydrolase [Candidatus Woesearchaeota archaeon]
MAKIIFLGTAGSAAVASKNIRSSGGIILAIDDSLQFHIDPGPGALQKARECNVNPHRTTAVLVTHNHINHCNDLNLVIEAMTHSGLERRGVVLGSKSVVQPTDGSHPFITRYHQNLVERIIPLEKNHKIGIESVEIQTIPVEHADPTAVGFKLFCPGFTMSYPGDTIFTPQLVEHLKGTDVLILNVPYPGKRGQGLNLDSDAAIKIISQAKPRLAVITHFGQEMIKADPMFEARQIQQATGVQTIAASDGLTISPTGYGNYHSPIKGF